MFSCYIDNKKQVAEILEEVIDHFPKNAKLVIRQATFSISEEFLRRIWNIKKKVNAYFILVIDRKALQKTRLLWQFVSRVYDRVYLADSHAKILHVSQVVEQDSAELPCSPVSVITSQNLTRGNRFESTIITSDEKVSEALLNDFEFLINRNSVPMHEVMPVSPFREADSQNTENPDQENENVKSESPIEDLASIFMPISDIAVILEVNEFELRNKINTPGSPEYLQYRRGKAKAKAQIRAQEMQLAQLGSPLGVQNVRDNLLDMEEDE